MEEKIEEALESQDLKQLMEEGIFDWLFSRWRQGGRWKGGQGRRSGDLVGSFQDQLKELYEIMGKYQKEYPRKVRLVRGNVRRVLLDLEDLKMMIDSGMTEKDVAGDTGMK